MNKLMISSLLITASLTMACSQSDDDTAKKNTTNTTPVEGTMNTNAGTMVTGANSSQDTTASMQDTTSSETTLSTDTQQNLADATAEVKEEVADATAEAKAEMSEAVDDTKAAVKDAVEVDVENDQNTDKVAMADAKAEVNKQPTDAAASASADLETGKTVYTQKCVACHGTGATGAPKLDDDSWSDRKAQGMDVVYEHAIKGYQGAKGYMPAKGGFMGLSDDEVKAAVDYMVSANK